MGWYLRKSKKLGPFRLNLSKSGLGISVGVKGARISTGPRGTEVHLGGGPLRYRQRIAPPPPRNTPNRTAPGTRPRTPPASTSSTSPVVIVLGVVFLLILAVDILLAFLR